MSEFLAGNAAVDRWFKYLVKQLTANCNRFAVGEMVQRQKILAGRIRRGESISRLIPPIVINTNISTSSSQPPIGNKDNRPRSGPFIIVQAPAVVKLNC
jgi:hypothetical protein